MKLYNRFSIGIVFDDEAKADKLKERLETVVDDLEITKTTAGYVELHLKCDSGTSSLVNGTRLRWDDTDDPNDDETLANFINWLKNFPL
jgi:hypothetical protein